MVQKNFVCKGDICYSKDIKHWKPAKMVIWSAKTAFLLVYSLNCPKNIGISPCWITQGS